MLCLISRAWCSPPQVSAPTSLVDSAGRTLGLRHWRVRRFRTRLREILTELLRAIDPSRDTPQSRCPAIPCGPVTVGIGSRASVRFAALR